MSKVYFLPNPTEADDEALQAFVDAVSGAVKKHQGPGPHKGTGTAQSVHGGGSVDAMELQGQESIFDDKDYIDTSGVTWRNELPQPARWAVSELEKAIGPVEAWGVEKLKFVENLDEYATRVDQSVTGIFDRDTGDILIALHGRWGRRNTTDMATTALHEIGHHYDYHNDEYASTRSDGIEQVWKTAVGKLTSGDGLGMATFEALAYPIKSFKSYNQRYGYGEARQFMAKETFAQLVRVRYSKPDDIPVIERELGLDPGSIEKTMSGLLSNAPKDYQRPYEMSEFAKSDRYPAEFVEAVLAGDIDFPYAMSVEELYRGWLIDQERDTSGNGSSPTV